LPDSIPFSLSVATFQRPIVLISSGVQHNNKVIYLT